MIKQELGQKTLGKGGDCFLVRINGIDRNEELIKIENFRQFLISEHFINPGFGSCGCPWYFVNVDTMRFAPGKPGVEYSAPIGDCWIDEDDFKMIWNIIKRSKKLGS